MKNYPSIYKYPRLSPKTGRVRADGWRHVTVRNDSGNVVDTWTESTFSGRVGGFFEVFSC